MSYRRLPTTLAAFSWFFIKKNLTLFIFALLFALAWALDNTLWPYVIMQLIDVITTYEGPKEDAWYALSYPIFLGITTWLLIETGYRLHGLLFARFLPKFEANIRLSMFSYVLRHSHHYFTQRLAGDIANRISDMPKSSTRLLLLVVQLFIPVFVALVISSLFFFHISALFTYILLSWIFVHLAICLSFSKSCSQASHLHSQARSQLVGRVVDSLSNHANVRLFARYRHEVEHLSHFQADEKKKHWYSLWVIEKMKFALSIVSFFGVNIAINGYMLYEWQQGNLTTGEVVFIFNTTSNITTMAWFAGLELPNLFKEMGVARQALAVIEETHEITDPVNAPKIEISQGEIVFQNVTFGYKEQPPLFLNKNLIIKAQQKVGLVGFSGSGKSTFIHLILRNYDLEKGKIFIDQQDIAQIDQASLRSQIAMIPQEPILFHRTLMENLRYGQLDASDEEVILAAKKAQCHQFIEKLPDGYRTYVGERGAKLSGGQRQRIAIARAILKQAPIFILDEATSALDSITEKEIQEGLELKALKQTVIVIAHRLSTLASMDRILVFDQGRIIEDGSHLELLKQEGHYSRLWNMQIQGRIPEHL